jgi:hypothetical protein
MRDEYAVTTVPDSHEEAFTASQCTCTFCSDMHKAVSEWDGFVPTTALQKRMKTAVAKMERRMNGSASRDGL